MVDFAPSRTGAGAGAGAMMHRTQSLDYRVVVEVEGVVEMVLCAADEEEAVVVVVMGRGDLAVQRGTRHGWRKRVGDGVVGEDVFSCCRGVSLLWWREGGSRGRFRRVGVLL